MWRAQQVTEQSMGTEPWRVQGSVPRVEEGGGEREGGYDLQTTNMLVTFCYYKSNVDDFTETIPVW